MPKKYEREIEQLLNDISDLNTDNKHSTVTQLPKVINNQLSKIGSLIGSLLTNPRNRLVTLLLSTVSLIALTTMLGFERKLPIMPVVSGFFIFFVMV